MSLICLRHTHTLPEEPELRVERGMQRQKETRRKRVIDKDVSLGIDAAPSVFQWNQLGPPSPRLGNNATANPLDDYSYTPPYTSPTYHYYYPIR